MGSAGPADVAGAAGILVQTPEVSELEIALLFPLCVASFAAFLFALSPRLYCEGEDEMGDIISSKIKDPYGESERFFCLSSEIQRCGGPSILENRHNGQAKAPSTGGRR